MAAAKEILEHLMSQLDFDVRVEIKAGETNRLNVVGEGDEKESLGALIGRKGERLSALQHLVNLLLSKRVGEWTRILVDVEDYRGRRERQLRDLANRAAERVVETGKMLQLEPMPALERRWIHLALRDHTFGRRRPGAGSRRGRLSQPPLRGDKVAHSAQRFKENGVTGHRGRASIARTGPKDPACVPMPSSVRATTRRSARQ
jgi:predicted RNA-binding protein YlqC (UPF0109 family)